jgi:hypothetical protein
MTLYHIALGRDQCRAGVSKIKNLNGSKINLLKFLSFREEKFPGKTSMNGMDQLLHSSFIIQAPSHIIIGLKVLSPILGKTAFQKREPALHYF